MPGGESLVLLLHELFVVVNKSDERIAHSKQERERGKSVVDAAIAGADLRYRAVMMSAWSFIIGVLPLVFASGAGSGAMKAIGICTCSGMLVSSVVGIVFVPALYALFQRLREIFAS